MKSSLYHLQLNVADSEFYKELLSFLGWKVIAEWKRGFGATDGERSLWIFTTVKQFTNRGFHRKATGLNHIAFRVGSREEVDEFYQKYLKPKNLSVLYGGPKEYPQYEPGYYAVYFEDPDRIKLEVVYKPGK